MPPSASRVAARASPAAIHASSEVRLIIQAQAAAGFFAPTGMTNAVPPATEKGSPSAFLNGHGLDVDLVDVRREHVRVPLRVDLRPDLVGDELVVLAEGVERVREALHLREAALRVVDLLEQLDSRDVARVVERRLALVVGRADRPCRAPTGRAGPSRPGRSRARVGTPPLSWYIFSIAREQLVGVGGVDVLGGDAGLVHDTFMFTRIAGGW